MSKPFRPGRGGSRESYPGGATQRRAAQILSRITDLLPSIKHSTQ
jgi:hypothetical protein